MAEDRFRVTEMASSLKQAMWDSAHEKNAPYSHAPTLQISPATWRQAEREGQASCDTSIGSTSFMIAPLATKRLLVVRDHFGSRLFKAKGGVIIDEAAMFQAAADEGVRCDTR